MNELPSEPRNGHLGYLLTAYLFDSLSAAGRKEVEAHLAGCAQCRAELETLRRTLGVAAKAFDTGGKEYVFEERRRQRVMRAARKARPAPSGTSLPGARWVWWLAAAGVGLLLVGLTMPTLYLARQSTRMAFQAESLRAIPEPMLAQHEAGAMLHDGSEPEAAPAAADHYYRYNALKSVESRPPRAAKAGAWHEEAKVADLPPAETSPRILPKEYDGQIALATKPSSPPTAATEPAQQLGFTTLSEVVTPPATPSPQPQAAPEPAQTSHNYTVTAAASSVPAPALLQVPAQTAAKSYAFGAPAGGTPAKAPAAPADFAAEMPAAPARQILESQQHAVRPPPRLKEVRPSPVASEPAKPATPEAKPALGGERGTYFGFKYEQAEKRNVPADSGGAVALDGQAAGAGTGLGVGADRGPGKAKDSPQLVTPLWKSETWGGIEVGTPSPDASKTQLGLEKGGGALPGIRQLSESEVRRETGATDVFPDAAKKQLGLELSGEAMPGIKPAEGLAEGAGVSGNNATLKAGNTFNGGTTVAAGTLQLKRQDANEPQSGPATADGATDYAVLSQGNSTSSARLAKEWGVESGKQVADTDAELKKAEPGAIEARDQAGKEASKERTVQLRGYLRPSRGQDDEGRINRLTTGIDELRKQNAEMPVAKEPALAETLATKHGPGAAVTTKSGKLTIGGLLQNGQVQRGAQPAAPPAGGQADVFFDEKKSLAIQVPERKASKEALLENSDSYTDVDLTLSDGRIESRERAKVAIAAKDDTIRGQEELIAKERTGKDQLARANAALANQNKQLAEKEKAEIAARTENEAVALDLGNSKRGGKQVQQAGERAAEGKDRGLSRIPSPATAATAGLQGLDSKVLLGDLGEIRKEPQQQAAQKLDESRPAGASTLVVAGYPSPATAGVAGTVVAADAGAKTKEAAQTYAGGFFPLSTTDTRNVNAGDQLGFQLDNLSGDPGKPPEGVANGGGRKLMVKRQGGVGGGGAPQAVTVLARESRDTNGNGSVDVDRIVTSEPLNDRFDALGLTVSGYTVVGTGADNNEFFVRLADGEKQAGKSKGAQVTPADETKPGLMTAAWFDGSGSGVDANDPIHLTFSDEAVLSEDLKEAQLGDLSKMTNADKPQAESEYRRKGDEKGGGGGFGGGRGRAGEVKLLPPLEAAFQSQKGKAVVDAGALERTLRGFRYFRAENPRLTFREFLRRPAPVPPALLTDLGLDEDLYIERYGTRPFVDCTRDNLSTFGMDVDTASYTLARSRLREGKLPEPDTVRVEEFLNYFKQPYTVSGDDAFGVFAEGAPEPFGGTAFQAVNDHGQDARATGRAAVELLKIGIKSREARPDERKPAMLTFVVDTSGSMVRDDRLELVREALKALVSDLAPDDTVAIVGFSSQAELVLPRTQARHKQRILDAVEALEAHGATNVEAGLNLAYRLADESYSADSVNRMILCSDGVANVGAKGPDEILKLVKVFAGRGIDLCTVGFGMGQYHDKMMMTLADNGNGTYHFVDSLAEARKVFREQLPPHLNVLAKDAKVQVVFNQEVVARYRLLGYEKRKIADADFRNDKITSGEVAHSTLVTVMYEILRKPGSHGSLGKVYLRWKDAGYHQTVVVERNYPLSEGILAGDARSASPELRFLACVARFAELLRDSPWVRDSSYATVLGQLYQLPPEFKERPEWKEVQELVRRAQELSVKQWLTDFGF